MAGLTRLGDGLAGLQIQKLEDHLGVDVHAMLLTAFVGQDAHVGAGVALPHAQPEVALELVSQRIRQHLAGGEGDLQREGHGQLAGT